jgi:hypothetical protein
MKHSKTRAAPGKTRAASAVAVPAFIAAIEARAGQNGREEEHQVNINESQREAHV